MDLNHKFSFPLLASALVGGVTLVSLQAETDPAQTPSVAVKKAAKAKQPKPTDPEAKEDKTTKPADSEEKESKETKATDGTPSDKPTESEPTEHESANASGGGGGGAGGGEVTNAPSRGAGNSDGAGSSFDFPSHWQGGGAPGVGSGGGGGESGGSSRSAARSRSSRGGSASGVSSSGGSGAGSNSGGSSSSGTVISDTASGYVTGGSLQFAICACITSAGGGSHVFVNPVSLVKVASTRVINASTDLIITQQTFGGASTITQPFLGAGGIIKEGVGSLTLSGVNTYTGLTQVNAGTLNIASGGVIPGSVTVNSGGTLSGNGSISIPTILNNFNANSGSNSLLTLNGGTLNPGEAGGSVGTVRMGSFVSHSGTINFDLGNPDLGSYDQFRVTGSVSLMGGLANFTLQDGALTTLGKPYFLIDNDGTDPIVGAFSNVAEGSIVNLRGMDFLATYLADSATYSDTGGNDFALSPIAPAAAFNHSAGLAVPEPSSALLLGSLSLLLTRRRRR